MRTAKPPTPRTTGRSRRLPLVTTLAAALCTGLTLLAPVASATPAAEPVTCETTSRSMPQAPEPGSLDPVGFEGTGTVTCRDAQGEPYLEGSSTFSGTLPSPEATAAGVTPVFRSRVDWSDGTVTTGTFTDFNAGLAENGALEFTINGVNDADSTRFGGYTVAASGQSVRVSSDPVEEVVNTQNGQVTYTP
ncbi:hypothetical protein [Streptomyces sp. NPDC057509]|uniref:hypothetical protein n=1 Tax=Streptomyces sp. NPDC057509 TaxID=3346152 RepID=UPI0036C32ADC